MKLKIGFTRDLPKCDPQDVPCTPPKAQAPRKSVVQVYFPGRNMTLAYYNDQFDLKCGDMVYVEGKMEGMRSYVTEVNYNFKIKVSDYKRVIAVVDTAVNGQFYIAGSHFVTFDRSALPPEKVALWFRPPQNDEDEIISGNDDTSFLLSDLKTMDISAPIAERGYNYYTGKRVRYICIDGTRGYALVEGSKAYEVEFEYQSGEIRNLVCSCFCGCNCKHEFAAMLQLQETLELISKHYEEEYEHAGYFAAISKGTLYSFVIDNKESGSFTL